MISRLTKPIFEKKIGSSNLGPTCLNQVQNEVFPHFLEFGSYVFFEIEYDDSLRQYLTSIRSKIHGKIFGIQISTKQAKIGHGIRFLAIFSSLHHQVYLILHRIAGWDNVYYVVELKLLKIFLRPKLGPNGSKSGRIQNKADAIQEILKSFLF